MKSASHFGLWLGVGVVIGTVAGFGTGYPAVGVTLGIGFGVLIAGVLGRQGGKPAEGGMPPVGKAPPAEVVQRQT